MSSPLFNEKTFAGTPSRARGDAMTVQGSINKTAILLLLLLASGSYAFAHPGVRGLWILGAVGGLVISLVLWFKPAWSPVLAPAYALLQGLFVGGISAVYSSLYNGIVMQAMLLTFGVLAGMLGLYSFRVIQATAKFRAIVGAATMGIAIFYLIAFVLQLFHVGVPFLTGNGWMGIGFSVVVCLIAAFNLIIDFDNIESGTAAGAPRYMEWYCGFGLLVTLVWLYLEILRLLAKLRSDD